MYEMEHKKEQRLKGRRRIEKEREGTITFIVSLQFALHLGNIGSYAYASTSKSPSCSHSCQLDVSTPSNRTYQVII